MMQFRDHVLVCGHRGDRVHGDENTMAAIQRSVRAGVDMIETDVRMTRDGHLILMHDPTVDRTTDGSGRVCDMPLSGVRRLNAAALSGSEQPPAMLEELLDLAERHPTLMLNIELKDYPDQGRSAFAFECAEKTAQLISEHGLGARTWINSFDGRLLEFVFRRFGRAFHYHGFYPWFILGKMDVDPESFIDLACMQHRALLESGEIIRCAEALCPREWFDYLLARGIMPLMAPSLREYPKYDLAFSWGSRIVNADDPAAMLAHLRAIGLHD